MKKPYVFLSRTWRKEEEEKKWGVVTFLISLKSGHPFSSRRLKLPLMPPLCTSRPSSPDPGDPFPPHASQHAAFRGMPMANLVLRDGGV